MNIAAGAVEGLELEQLLRAGADLARVGGEIEVGLVPLAQASPGLRSRIRDAPDRDGCAAGVCEVSACSRHASSELGPVDDHF